MDFICSSVFGENVKKKGVLVKGSIYSINLCVNALLVYYCLRLSAIIQNMDIRFFMHKKRRLEQEAESFISKSCVNSNDKNSLLAESTTSKAEIVDLDLPPKNEPIKQVVLREFPRRNKRSF